MSTQLPTLEMTLADVAALANVQRPVVSMWRKRSTAGAHPFPTSVRTDRGVERFDAHQVAAWLEATNRGNNADASADLTAYAQLSTGSANSRSFEALTALLSLRRTSGESLSELRAAGLLDLADEYDPNDSLLYAELERTEELLPELAAHAEQLVDAAYNEAAAFESLLARHHRSGNTSLLDFALTEPAMDLVAGTALELAADLEIGHFSDSSQGGSEVLLSIAERAKDSSLLSFTTQNYNDAGSRLARRRLLVHGLDCTTKSASAAHTEPTVHVAAYPAASGQAMTGTEMLASVEETYLQMDDQQRAVILAPASVLCDGLRETASGTGVNATAARLRSDLLRGGRIRAIIKLPAGLLRSKPREQQALWILGPSFAEVDIADRWTMVADLSAQRLTQDVVQDLIGDICASMGNKATVRAHSFRFARLVLTRLLLASKGSLVAGSSPAQAKRRREGASVVVRVEQLVRQLQADSTPSSSLRVSVSPVIGTAPTPLALSQLIATGAVKYIPGQRLTENSATGGNTRIIGPAELLAKEAGTSSRAEAAQQHQRSMDLLDFSAAVPNGRLSQPGDVIFCTSPKPAAMVDSQGGSVVVFPARILRINTKDSHGLHPHVLAWSINAQGANAKDWKRWLVLPVAQTQHQPLTDVLAEVEHARQQTAERLKRLDELSNLIKDGVAGGSLCLPVRTATPEGTI